MVLIAQLSDTHITAGADGSVDDTSHPVRSLRAAIESLLALPVPPGCVVVTGDLTNAGLPAEYARLRVLLSACPMPVYVLPGNHDDRAALRATFPPPGEDTPASPSAPVHYSVDLPGARLVCCDSTLPGEPGGDLDQERLDRLDADLAAAPTTPTVVALHHPPYRIGIRFIDRMGFARPEPFARLIRRHPQVVRVISGHVHRGSVTSFAGTVATTCPSTWEQLYLDLGDPGQAAVTSEPAGLALHLVDGDTAVTHFVPVGDHPPVMHVD